MSQSSRRDQEGYEWDQGRFRNELILASMDAHRGGVGVSSLVEGPFVVLRCDVVLGKLSLNEALESTGTVHKGT